MTETHITIRPANDSDAEAIFNVHRAAIRELCATHYTRSQIAGWLDSLTSEAHASAMDAETMVVAEDEAGIVGFGSLSEGDAEIRAIFIHPDHAASGIGRQILRELEAIALRSGLQRLTLKSTLNAVGFYQREGYGDAETAMHRTAAGAELPCLSMSKRIGEDDTE